MAKARLGSTFEALSGRIGNTVLSNEQDGTSVRSYNPISNQPNTPAQLARQAAFTKASQTWTTLAPAVVASWRSYSLGLRTRNPLTGRYRSRSARNVFVGRYAKLLQISATHALPEIPAGPFVVPDLTVTAAASTGSITFTGSGPTPTDVRFEALVQRLPSQNAIPAPDGYRSAGIVVLDAADGNKFSVSVTAGHWAVAYNFVDDNSGLETPRVELPVLSVALSVAAGGSEAATSRTTQKRAA